MFMPVYLHKTSLSKHAADVVLILDLRAANLAALRSASQRSWIDAQQVVTICQAARFLFVEFQRSTLQYYVSRIF